MQEHDAVRDVIAIAAQTDKEAREFLINSLIIGGVTLGYVAVGIFWLSLILLG